MNGLRLAGWAAFLAAAVAFTIPAISRAAKTSANQPGTSSQRRRYRGNYMLVIAILSLMAGLAVLTFGGRASGPRSETPANLEPLNASTEASSPGAPPFQGGRLDVENVILTRFGFEPSEISRSQGPFLLNVENRSQIGDVDYFLDRASGGRIQQRHVPRQKLDWHDVLLLPPGEYVLAVASNPKWRCMITIH
jgi:hypothetical protein